MKRFVFLAGLPRSGTTLLAALLAQREDTYVSTLSTVDSMLRHAYLSIPNEENYRAGEVSQRDSLIRNMLDAAYGHTDKPIVIDKGRAWGTPFWRNVLRDVLGEDPVILAPVRPLTEIVSSFVRLCRSAPNNYLDKAMISDDFHSYWRKPIDDARVDWLLSPNNHLTAAMLGLHGAYQDESAHLFHIIEYASLSSDPRPVMREIEAFLDLEPFDYSFTQIVGQPHNDAEVYGIPNMHHVRERIERIDPPPETILSPYAIARCELEDFWS